MLNAGLTKGASIEIALPEVILQGTSQCTAVFTVHYEVPCRMTAREATIHFIGFVPATGVPGIHCPHFSVQIGVCKTKSGNPKSKIADVETQSGNPNTKNTDPETEIGDLGVQVAGSQTL